MLGIPTIYDPRSKGNCWWYTLKTHSFQGYVFGPGKGVPVILNVKKRNCLQFMCCKGYAKGGCGLIWVISPIAFYCLPVSQYFIAQFAWFQGLWITEESQWLCTINGLDHHATRTRLWVSLCQSSPLQMILLRCTLILNPNIFQLKDSILTFWIRSWGQQFLDGGLIL